LLLSKSAKPSDPDLDFSIWPLTTPECLKSGQSHPIQIADA